MDFTLQYTNDAEEKILLRKIDDLIKRSEKTYSVLYSHFLTPAQQILIGKVREFYGFVEFTGGYPEAERKVCRIQTAEYQQDEGVPYILYKASVTAPDADISHRDVLGALMGMGIKREMIGDILICDNSAFFFCDCSISSFIEINLDKIGRYRIELSQAEPEEIPSPELEKRIINISSPRLDNICAEGFSMSRTKAADIIRKGLVAVNWQICDNVSSELKGGERISMRGKGKLLYSGITGTSKKGRLFAEVMIYK